MRRRALLPLLLVLGTACEISAPAEVRSAPTTFPVIANWSASATPVGTSTVRATLAVKQYLGFHLDLSLGFTGAPGTSYQWRIFRGNCATTEVAASVTAPTGLLVFSTLQAYPDVQTSTSGAATITAAAAGMLDSLTAYSVRVRVAQTSTSWNGTSPVSCGDLKRTAG